MSRETPETRLWSDRDLMLATYFLAVETNGTVKTHDRTLYGWEDHGQVGLVQQVCLHRLC